MIIATSLIISFFIVLAIKFYRARKSDEFLIRNLISITFQMHMYSSLSSRLNYDGMEPEIYKKVGVLVKEAKAIAEETGKGHIILLAKKMSNVYDSLKVKGG